MKKTLFYSTLLALLIDAFQFMHASASSDRIAKLAPAGNPVAITATNAQITSTAPIATPTPTPPTVDPVAAAAHSLALAGMNTSYAPLYVRVQAATGTPWQIIASIHLAETHQSGDTSRNSSAGAVGPFQFMPATWRVYAMDGNGDGVAQITNVEDAAMTAGRYLAAGGAARGNYDHAIYNYNHSNAYVDHVMTTADKLGL